MGRSGGAAKRSLSFAALLVLGVVGCGGGKADVTGKVTLNNQPIPWGRITFVSEAGNKPAISSPIRNGTFTIKDCPVGKAKISIESWEARAPNRNVPESMKGFKPPEGVDEPPPEVIGKYVPIASRYTSPDTSGLEYQVKRGENTCDLPLGP